MNLPCSVRFKWKNVILVGILPGPSEPKGTINSYMEPLVKELQDFWAGVKLCMHSSGSSLSQTVVRCALMCVAGWKLCGFLAIQPNLVVLSVTNDFKEQLTL